MDLLASFTLFLRASVRFKASIRIAPCMSRVACEIRKAHNIALCDQITTRNPPNPSATVKP